MNFEDTIIESLDSNNKILSYFNKMLHSIGDKRCQEFHPDINGYCLIFLQPPHLSGMHSETDTFIEDVCKDIVLLATDATPSSLEVKVSEVPTHNGAIPYGTQVSGGTNFQVTYIDNSNLDLCSLHIRWVQYIEDITRGVIEPDNIYLTSKLGEIDYVTSAYVIRFKPTANPSFNDIVYIGKACGIFPTNYPDKEIIGRRDSNQLTIVPMSYTCTLYRRYLSAAVRNLSSYSHHDWVGKEFKEHVEKFYSQSIY